MGDTPRIDDETYRLMSELAYENAKAGTEYANLPGWQVLEDTHGNGYSGFDAVTFYNPETGQAVISYRGTEGSAGWDRKGPDFLADGQIAIPELGRKIEQSTDFTPDWLSGGIQKVKDVTGLTHLDNAVGELDRQIDKKLNPFPNQMYEAEDYAKDMQNKYKNLDFSLTGHSLGGGNAQYAAAHTGMTAVTFSAPSVISSLTPSLKRKAEEGGFDNQIVNFGHPGDFVASGFFGGYDRHVGSMYYINSNYKDMNDNMSMGDKMGNTFGGKEYHDLKQYQFENGYISNDLYDPTTGEKINKTPREPSNIMTELADVMRSFGVQTNKMVAGVGSVGGASGLIQVTPEELKSVASRWKQNAQQCNAELNQVRTRMAQYLHTSRSRRLEPIVTQLDASIHELGTWHMKHTSQFLNFIDEKADAFRQADESPVHF
ncbi:hypothetical protein MHI48_02220 [Paenibacillus sp. FSL H7-0942]|uniref:Fungal lipase-like domain-containing protein n=1 Tax=Paenibacillus amylolyticus TaxID=1451 RepID=A0ABD8ATV8_PAEAM|nr:MULTISPECIES: hypothetical protein [Paenibacillus]ETT32425.1 hypothetical protein C161_23349 [Paenibacillus sp. FSL R5-192]ETT42300.1 hypothetical protein C170_27853 [Paenibacillus sp. FSL H7-689]OME95573.1 hypothetical protein BK124_21135 [Paenibacillus amylolyticus]OMF00057.1 hypothetical protein BK129_27775 [Paenibacillus amylolyticus]